MITLLASAPALPLGKSGKFVAAAYIVVFVIILVYVAIMSIRAQRVERDLEQLRQDIEAARGDGRAPEAPPGQVPGSPAGQVPETPAGQVPGSPAVDPERSGSRL